MPLTDPDEISRRNPARRTARRYAVQLFGASERAPNRWVYAAREVVPLREGRYAVSTEEDAWRGSVFNGLEANNTETGIQGSGDDVSLLREEIDLRPLGPGAVVLNAVDRMNDQGRSGLYIAVPNNVGGSCLA